jgi:integrase
MGVPPAPPRFHRTSPTFAFGDSGFGGGSNCARCACTIGSFSENRAPSVKVVQQQFGHKSASMTLDVYSHLFPDELDTQATRLDGLRSAAPADSVRTQETDAEIVAIADRL